MNQTSKLSLRLKIGYGAGDMVSGLAFNTLNFFYLYYLNTVIGLPAYLAGMVLLIGRIWDGVTDPFMGMIVDSTTAKQGKHRFWLLIGIIPFAITFVLLWVRFPGGQWTQFIIYSVLFILFSTAFTLYNIPYGSMTADLTQDYNERTSLTGVRMVFSLLAMIIGAGATGLLSGQKSGYMGMAIIYSVIMVGTGLTAYFSTSGRDKPAHNPEGIHVRIWAQAFKNRPFVLLVTAYLFMTLATCGVSGIFVYYVKFNLGLNDGFQSSLIMGVLVLSAIAALPLWAWVSNAFSKKTALFAGMLMFGLFLIAIAKIGLSLGQPVFYSMVIATGAGLSAFFIVLWSMIPDVVEYGQMQTGHRHEGVYYGLWFFVQKLGMAASAAINGAILSVTGFTQSASTEILIQPASALFGIAWLLAGIPLIFIALGLGVLVFYPITEEMHGEIRKKIGE